MNDYYCDDRFGAPLQADEWHSAVRALTEVDRYVNADSHRAALGLVGEADDDRYGGQL